MTNQYTLQNGFAAIIAIVLIVIFALIGTFMLTTVGNQNMTTALSQREIQSWFAAQSGIEWAVRPIVTTASGCPGSCSGGVCGTITGASPLTLGGSANGHTVALTCNCTCISEGSTKYAIYHLTATATIGSPSDLTYVSRTARATIRE